jgi:hypothetical protein
VWSAAATSSRCLDACCPEHPLEGGAASPQLSLGWPAPPRWSPSLQGLTFGPTLRLAAAPWLTRTPHAALTGLRSWASSLSRAASRAARVRAAAPRRVEVPGSGTPSLRRCGRIATGVPSLGRDGDDLEMRAEDDDADCRPWRRLLPRSPVPRRSRRRRSSWTTARARVACFRIRRRRVGPTAAEPRAAGADWRARGAAGADWEGGGMPARCVGGWEGMQRRSCRKVGRN